MAKEGVQSAREALFSGRWLRGDRAMWILIFFLCISSLLVVYSSTASMAYRKAGGDTFHYFISQFMYMGLGFGLTWFFHKVNYQFYARIATPLFLIGLGLMALTFVLGVNLNSAARWLRIPILNLTFQPSDFLKVALVVVLARQLSRRQKIIDKIPLLPSLSIRGWSDPREQRKNRDILFRTTLPILLPIALACGAILVSNFSTSAIVFLSCLVMLIIGRVRLREIFRLVGLALLVLVVFISVMSFAGLGRAETWRNRIMSYAGVELSDSEVGAKGDDNLQVEQAKIAIASGGLFGKGPGNSTQRTNLPHSYSDFAYAFIVEEYGIIGAAFILCLYLWIFFRAILIFQRCETAFPSLLVLGLSLMITLQAMVNMCVSVHLIPVTGQTLPLISLGGSSVIFTSISLGMIIGVSRQMEEGTLQHTDTK